MPRPEFLSIVIPAYNEEARIGRTLEHLERYLASRFSRFEVLVVDDGSADRTREVVEQAASRWPRLRCVPLGMNQGKGAAVREGMLRARGDYLLFSDADLSTPIEEVERLLQALDTGAQIAIGSRALASSHIAVHQPWYREQMGKTFNRLVRTLVLRGIQDTQCGFKLFEARAARELFGRAKLDRFAFDVELLWLARGRFKVVEVPVTWSNDRHSRVSPVRDSARMLVDLLRIRWLHR